MEKESNSIKITKMLDDKKDVRNYVNKEWHVREQMLDRKSRANRVEAQGHFF